MDGLIDLGGTWIKNGMRATSGVSSSCVTIVVFDKLTTGKNPS